MRLDHEQPAAERKWLLMVTTSYPSAGDGSEAAGAFVKDLAQELLSRANVCVVAPGMRNEREQVGPGWVVWRYAAPRVPLSTLKISAPRNWPAIFSTLRNGQKAVMSAIEALAVERAIAFWVLPCGFWLMRACRKRSIPYDTWALGSDIWSLGQLAITRFFLKQTMAKAQRRYADGLQLAKDAEEIAKNPVSFLPSTRRIDLPAEMRPLSQSPPYRLVYIGRWHSNKGIDLLLESLYLLDEASWNRIAAIDIYGGGPLQEQVEQHVSELRAHGRPIHLHGFIDQPKAIAAILESDYVLIPSRIESIPLIFSDAMKCGRPVIAMPVGDLPALIEEPGTGVVAQEVSAPAFADTLAKALLRSPCAHEKPVASMARRFSLSSIAETLAVP